MCDIHYNDFLCKSIDSLLGLANTICYPSGNPAEGIVVKTDDDQEPRVSFKIMSQVYMV